ncbi:MAG: ribonuclease P protein component [Armatimonadetes bacterium]|nr:ribonuclease P protein component [Armatimonadota bacterium]
MPQGTLRTLRRRKEIDYLFAAGKRVSGTIATVVAAPSPDGTSGCLFVAGRKVGEPVKRNRARRRLRAAMRSVTDKLAPGWWVALIARPQAAMAEYMSLVSEVETALKRLGLLRYET